jgi:hypothetical protein
LTGPLIAPLRQIGDVALSIDQIDPSICEQLRNSCDSVESATLIAISHIRSGQTVDTGQSFSALYSGENPEIYQYIINVGQPRLLVSGPASPSDLERVRAIRASVSKAGVESALRLRSRASASKNDAITAFVLAFSSLEMAIDRLCSELSSGQVQHLEKRFRLVVSAIELDDEVELIDTFQSIYSTRNDLYHQGKTLAAYPTDQTLQLVDKLVATAAQRRL